MLSRASGQVGFFDAARVMGSLPEGSFFALLAELSSHPCSHPRLHGTSRIASNTRKPRHGGAFLKRAREDSNL
jgi:hypothetical protein